MVFIGNLLWFAFGGIWLGLAWMLVGFLWHRTTVGVSLCALRENIAVVSSVPMGMVTVNTCKDVGNRLGH